MRNLSVYDIYINKIIKSYFNLYFKNTVILKKYVSNKLKHLSLKKIYVSNPEIKHTNYKAVITIYVYNKENLSLSKRIKKLRKIFKKSNKNFNIKNNIAFLKANSINLFNKNTRKGFAEEYRKAFLMLKKNNFKEISYNLYNKIYKFIINRQLIFIRKHKLNINLNKYKFEDIFLYKLGTLIKKFYKKKIEFNIINLRSIVFHADIFTEFLKKNLKRRKMNVFRMMNFILNKINLPKVNTIKERGRLINNVNYNLLENRFINLNINSILNKGNLDEKLRELYYNIFFKKEYIYYDNTSKQYISVDYIKYILKKNTIFNNIKHKNIGGIRLEAKGRLTRRYRADRAVFKVRLKGGLKSIDSSFKGLSVINFRGYAKSNVEYSIRTSKRRIGSFAVKG